jgi:hypothetical protein
VGATLCNIAVLAAAIGNLRIDSAALASKGLHHDLLHHPPIIHVILIVWTMTILVGGSPDFGAPTLRGS